MTKKSTPGFWRMTNDTQWRDDSVCRHDPKYILKTYRNMLDSNDALITEFLRRGMLEKAAVRNEFAY